MTTTSQWRWRRSSPSSGADDRVLKDPAPVVAVNELADSSVNLVVRPWCQGSDYWALEWDLTRRMKEGLERAGCSIPHPQRDVI
jgi:small conductance mechanosensitive channel